MLIYQCDICRQQIEDLTDVITVRRNFDYHSMHTACAKPILDFLQKHVLIEEEEIIC